MKFLKSMLTAAFVVLSVCANAQFQNTRPARSSSSTRISKASVLSDTDNYYRVQLGYATAKASGEDLFGNLDGEKLNGFTLGILYGININHSMPLFLEVGANLTSMKMKVSYCEKDYWGDYEYEEDFKLNVLNLTVPVNISYKIALGNGFSIAPHAGVHLKANLTASAEDKWTEDGEVDSEKWNMFDKDDVDDDVWKRVQVGGQVGLGFNLKCIYVGYQYQFDFTNLCKEGGKLPTQSIVLGYTF